MDKLRALAAVANQVLVMRGRHPQRLPLLGRTGQQPLLPADAAAAYARGIRGGRSGPSMTMLAAQDCGNTVTSRTGSIAGVMTAALGKAIPAQQDAHALHFW